MKYQRREGTADGNDKYSIANQGGRCNDNNDNDDDDDNDEENDDEKYSKACLGGQNDNDIDDEEGAVILTRVTTNSQGERYGKSNRESSTWTYDAGEALRNCICRNQSKLLTSQKINCILGE